MYYVYALRSKQNNKRYIGYTHKSPEERLHDHNTGSNVWTRQNSPFELIYHESLSDKKSALAREKYLKTGAGRKFLDNIAPL
ncbi:MAG: GIY-YIG nuclease family protein [Candidatus Omnitrophica bacterium]|nr:GIY-YIG nuclease family protein [Candidatus Omnitrophota bacterium]